MFDEVGDSYGVVKEMSSIFLIFITYLGVPRHSVIVFKSV